jgi:hypothetical protein
LPRERCGQQHPLPRRLEVNNKFRPSRLIAAADGALLRSSRDRLNAAGSISDCEGSGCLDFNCGFSSREDTALLVIISSNAAADLAKERLGKAHRIVVIAGIMFSTIAGLALIVFICERVFGMPEMDLSIGHFTRLFNNCVESILLPFFGFFLVSTIIVFYVWSAVSDNKSLSEILHKYPKVAFIGYFIIALILALIGLILRLFGWW